MKHFNFYTLSVIFSLFVLSACSPHPSTGVWKSTTDNALGVSKIVVAFEGRAEFTSTKPIKAVWHCFWGKENEKTLNLDCMPSIDTEQARQFVFVAKSETSAELHENGKVLVTLTRVDENPVLTK